MGLGDRETLAGETGSSGWVGAPQAETCLLDGVVGAGNTGWVWEIAAGPG